MADPGRTLHRRLDGVTEDAPPPRLRWWGPRCWWGWRGCLSSSSASWSWSRSTPGGSTLAITTALFFLALGAGLVLCARGLFRVRSWARGPVVAVELIGVLLSFSFWGGETTLVAVLILLVSVAALVGVLHPASTRALAADER